MLILLLASGWPKRADNKLFEIIVNLTLSFDVQTGRRHFILTGGISLQLGVAVVDIVSVLRRMHSN